MRPQAFFEQAEASYRSALLATAAAECVCRDYGVAGLRIRICFAGLELVRPLTRALDHLRLGETAVTSDRLPDLTILAWASGNARHMPPSPGAGCWDMGPNGRVRSLSDQRFATSWMFVAGGFQMLDRESSRALYWVRELGSMPYWETAAPMRFLLDAWFAGRGLHLVHAAAVGDGRGAILLTGPGGSGKSSTALACLASGLNYLSDDYVLLDPQDWSAHSIYSSGKVDSAGLQRMPFLEGAVTNRSRPEKEKALLFVHESFPHKVITGPVPVQAIACPVVGKGSVITTRMVPVPGATVLQGLAVSTLLQSSKPSALALKVLARLARERPAFELHLGEDASQAATGLDSLLPREKIPGCPLVSVIIPAFDPGPFLRYALASVLTQDAARKRNALEVIVVDDGSHEDLSSVIAEFSPRLDFRLHRQSTQGPSAARNLGIRLACGELLAFLDADDVWPAGSLDARIEALCREPEVQLVHGTLRNLVQLEEAGDPVTCFGPPRYSFNVGSMLFRRELFDRAGLLDERLRFSEDVDFLVRVADSGAQRRLIETVCLYYRRHGGGLTGLMRPGVRSRAHLKSWAQILKRSLDRRRA